MSAMAQPERRSGWVQFASVVLFAVAFFRIIEAIAYFRHSHALNDLAGGYFANHMWGWGLWDLCIAALGIFAGLSLLKGGGFGRVIAYMWAILAVVNGFMVISLAPWLGATTIAVSVLVIYGLAMHPEEGEGL